ncbi:MAG: hypothetical protein ABSC23_03790 [Bryobacteraceae bacterium]|jgi:hypothetical protein
MSLNLITTAEHAFAKAAQDIVAAAKFVTTSVLPILKKAAADESTVEAITGLVDPNAVNVERAAFAVLGTVIKVIEDAGTAANAGGLSVTLDAALVADIKAVLPSVKAAVAPVPTTKAA